MFNRILTLRVVSALAITVLALAGWTRAEETDLIDDAKKKAPDIEIEVTPDIVYGHASGEDLKMDLARPKGLTHSAPAILWIHAPGPAARESSRPVAPAGHLILLVAGLLVAAVGVLAFNLPRHGAASERLAGSHAQVTKELAAETAARKQAVTWILRQVSRAAVVSCDPQVCADLVSAGFPSANVLMLGPASNDPLGSALVVATGPIRAQYGSRWSSVYAPATIASFGSRAARIDIRLVYPGGAARYGADQRTALRDRKTAGARLLANSHIEASATARAQLLRGDADPRLPQLLAMMAESHPVTSWTSSTSRQAADPPACCGQWTWPRWTARRT